MKLDPRWIVLDLADCNDGDLMVHSIAACLVSGRALLARLR